MSKSNQYQVELLGHEIEVPASRALVALRKAVRIAISAGEFPLQETVEVTVKSHTFNYLYEVIRPYTSKKRRSFKEKEIKRRSHKRAEAERKLKNSTKLPNVISNNDYNDNAVSVPEPSIRKPNKGKPKASSTTSPSSPKPQQPAVRPANTGSSSKIAGDNKTAANNVKKQDLKQKKQKQFEIEQKRKNKLKNTKKNKVEEKAAQETKPKKKTKNVVEAKIDPSLIATGRSSTYFMDPAEIEKAQDAANMDSSSSSDSE